MAGSRMPIVAANWKMHKTHLEAIQAVQKLGYLVTTQDTESVEVVVCPPFTALRSVQTLIESDRLPFALGAQDVHGRGLRGHARRTEVCVRDRRSLGTAAAVRGDRRGRREEAQGGLRTRHDPDRKSVV